ncbi:hypothetical protein FH972_002648 [Carpinus fangiana]|uniref:Uncharacterized protein n=1 Tax=Carpinus fangiana TaxID=176857 RepID=A0A5N6QIY5_9ROSI|nr:hypothetical protein FH972_002648 [Carpinus fangiana]
MEEDRQSMEKNLEERRQNCIQRNCALDNMLNICRELEEEEKEANNMPNQKVIETLKGVDDQMEESFDHLSHHDAHNNDDFAMIPEIESMELQRGHPVPEHEDEHLDLSIEQIKKSRKEVQQAADPGKIQLLLEYRKLEFLNKNQDLLALDKLFNLKHHLLNESSQPSCKDLLWSVTDPHINDALAMISSIKSMELQRGNPALRISESVGVEIVDLMWKNLGGAENLTLVMKTMPKIVVNYSTASCVMVLVFKHRWRWKFSDKHPSSVIISSTGVWVRECRDDGGRASCHMLHKWAISF